MNTEDANGNGENWEELPPAAPRFSLLALMGLVALIAVTLSLWRVMGPAIGAGVVIFALAILGHIAGNAIGSQLRDGTSARLRKKFRRDAESGASVAPATVVSSEQFAPVTQLSHRKPLGWFMIIGTALGAIAGGGLGGYWMYRQNPAGATLMGLAIGGVATGLLGGLWAFWSCSLAQVVFGAWREATDFSKKNRER